MKPIINKSKVLLWFPGEEEPWERNTKQVPQVGSFVRHPDIDHHYLVERVTHDYYRVGWAVSMSEAHINLVEEVKEAPFVESEVVAEDEEYEGQMADFPIDQERKAS